MLHKINTQTLSLFLVFTLYGCLSTIGNDGPLPELSSTKIFENCLDLSGEYKFSLDKCNWNKQRSGLVHRPLATIDSFVESKHSSTYLKPESKVTIVQSNCKNLKLTYLNEENLQKSTNIALTGNHGINYKFTSNMLTGTVEQSSRGCFIGCGTETNRTFIELSQTKDNHLLYRAGHREVGALFLLFPYAYDHIINCKLKKIN